MGNMNIGVRAEMAIKQLLMILRCNGACRRVSVNR